MDRSRFYASVRRRASGIFGTSLSHGQVMGCETLLDEGQARSVPLRHLAYVLATAYLETGHAMQPIREKGNGDGPDKDPWDDYLEKYDTGRLAKALGNTPEADGDGVLYCGRGYVMITGRSNYERASRELGIDLLGDPKRAMEPQIAAQVIFEGMEQGWFTGKGLSDYISDGRADYKNARRIVNGTDRADDIAGYAKAFEAALREASYSRLGKPAHGPEDDFPPVTPGAEETPSAGKRAGIAAIVVAGLAAAWATISGWACAIPIIQHFCGG